MYARSRQAKKVCVMQYGWTRGVVCTNIAAHYTSLCLVREYHALMGCFMVNLYREGMTRIEPLFGHNIKSPSKDDDAAVENTAPSYIHYFFAAPFRPFFWSNRTAPSTNRLEEVGSLFTFSIAIFGCGLSLFGDSMAISFHFLALTTISSSSTDSDSRFHRPSHLRFNGSSDRGYWSLLLEAWKREGGRKMPFNIILMNAKVRVVQTKGKHLRRTVFLSSTH